jgi:tryptophanyl-tRNA synthetase
LTYFEESDEKIAEVDAKYRSGEMLTGELKKLAIALLQYVFPFARLQISWLGANI